MSITGLDIAPSDTLAAVRATVVGLTEMAAADPAATAPDITTGNVVGAGIKPSSLIQDAGLKAEVQRLWLDWTDEADAEGFTDFYGLQRRVAREVFLAGEVFLRFRPRRPEDGLAVPLQLQMIPSEMLPLTKTEPWGGNPVRQGIEFDAIGRRVSGPEKERIRRVRVGRMR